MKRVTPVVAVLAALVLLMTGLVYIAGQQILRQGANDPQIQMAEDGAAQLAQGHKVAVDSLEKVDAASSLAPFRIIYDDDGKVVDATAQLHGATPNLPQGVLDAAKTRHEYRVTWQPEQGVRIAAVIVHANGGTGGYVLAGRNLGEVEHRANQLLMMCVIALLAGLAVIGAFAMLPKRK
jgi:hypothetical protein